jgi:hypothetical protein
VDHLAATTAIIMATTAMDTTHTEIIHQTLSNLHNKQTSKTKKKLQKREKII